MTDPQRHFLKRQAKAFSEMAEAHLPWVLDGMEPQNRRSSEARRQTMAAGRAIGISDADLAGFFRIDRTSVWYALAEGPISVRIVPADALSTVLAGPSAGKNGSTLHRYKYPVKRSEGRAA